MPDSNFDFLAEALAQGVALRSNIALDEQTLQADLLYHSIAKSI